MDQTISDAVETLVALQDDGSVSKNLALRLGGLAEVLQSDGNMDLNVTKVLEELDEISQNINIQPFIRTQLWNVSSMLESFNVRV